MKSRLFYQNRLPRPELDRAEGIYLWAKDGRRYLDGSSGAMVSNIGHSNPAVLEAEKFIDDVIHVEAARVGPFSARVAGCMVVAYCSTIGVRISGGQITDTPIPSGAHSSRSTRARPITPALDAA